MRKNPFLPYAQRPGEKRRLTPEERQKTYLEEKARSEARDSLAAEKKTEKRRLTPEERRKIYLEEKARVESKDKLSADQEQATVQRDKFSAIGCLVLLGIAISGALFCPIAPDIEPAASLRCKDYVRTVLDSPSSADFPFFGAFARTTERLGNNTYRITSYFDSKNVFGTTMRTEYVCTIRFEGDPENLTDEAMDRRRNWKLIDLKFGKPLPQ